VILFTYLLAGLTAGGYFWQRYLAVSLEKKVRDRQEDAVDRSPGTLDGAYRRDVDVRPEARSIALNLIHTGVDENRLRQVLHTDLDGPLEAVNRT
jgi:hypothetical protein